MGGDHLSNAVGIDNTGEQDEGHKMVVKNVRLQVQVGDDQSPDAEERQKTDEGAA